MSLHSLLLLLPLLLWPTAAEQFCQQPYHPLVDLRAHTYAAVNAAPHISMYGLSHCTNVPLI